MVETEITLERSVALRVAVIAADAETRASLGARVETLGYTVTDVDHADIVLADATASELELPAVVIGATDADFSGILPTSASDAQIDAALRAVAAGLFVRPSMAPVRRFAALEEPELAALLTPREIEVLVGLSDGMSNKAVARRLDISQHTVKFHVESIFRKLGATTRAEAVAKGLRRGLVSL